MKDKGFTLVELLAVIAIIALLALASFEALDVINRGNKEKAEAVQVDNILTSAISYVPTSKVKLPTVPKGTTGCTTLTYQSVGNNPSGSNVCEVKISFKYLYDEGILEETISNPRLEKEYNMDSSYVTIIYVTNSTKPNTEEVVGKYDGAYFYQLSEVYK